MNDIGGYRGGNSKEFGDIEGKIGVPLSRYQVYAWGIMMYLFPYRWWFPHMTLHGLTYIWLVGEPQHMIHPFSMFKDGRELDNFPRGR